MLNTYSTKGNTCIIPFAIKTPVSNFSFMAEFKGGDAFGMTGKTRRATYKTTNPMEQLAIEKSEMFKSGIVRLDSSVETEREIRAKAEMAAEQAKREAEEEARRQAKEMAAEAASEEKETKKKTK